MLEDIKNLFHIKTTEQKLWLRPAEGKELLKISSGTLQNLRINGTLTYSRVGGTLYYNYKDIEKMLNKNSVVMNYIRHLTGFYDKIEQDDRLNPTHISLYLALFQFWNLKHFQNPISISRNEIMQLRKISAYGTYHKCIKDLQEFGYIEYIPSFNSYKGSMVNLHNFENSEIQNLNRKRIKKQATSEHALNSPRIKIETGTEQALIRSIKNTNILNNKHSVSTQKNISVNKFLILNETTRSEESQKEKLREKKKDALIARKNDEANFSDAPQFVMLSGVEALKKAGSKIPPEFFEVQMYFEEKDSTKLEAEKFYNHYESNGWLVGGKSKMKNWQAGARNWLLNSKKFNSQNNVTLSLSKNQQSKPSHLNATTDKSYRDEL